jgi:dihydrofolate reductase
MRKVRYSVGVSLDGYIAAPDGSVDWLNRATAKAEGEGEDFGMGAFFRSIDTVLMGRKTYEVALQMGMGKGGYPKMRNYVFSRGLPPGRRDGVEFVAADPAEFIARLRQQPGKDIWLCGGGELAREFLKAGVLDEIMLGIAPVLIGGGRLTFPPGFPETEVALTEIQQYRGGVVGLTYAVMNAAYRAASPAAPKKGRKKPRRK